MLTGTGGVTKFLVVSLAAIFVLSRNAPPQETATHIPATFLPVVLSNHRNDQSFISKVKMMSVFMQRMTLVISSYISDVSPNRPGSLLLS